MDDLSNVIDICSESLIQLALLIVPWRKELREKKNKISHMAICFLLIWIGSSSPGDPFCRAAFLPTTTTMTVYYFQLTFSEYKFCACVSNNFFDFSKHASDKSDHTLFRYKL